METEQRPSRKDQMTMVPPISHPNWRRLVAGEIEVRSSNLSFNMLLFHLRLGHKNNPSDANTAALIEQGWQFFVKFEKLLQQELSILFH
jgi:hypothetical protein